MSPVMTGKERILKALELEEPDTVPVFEMGINEASIVNLGKQFTDDVPAVKHITDMDLEEQLRYMDLLSLILKELGNDGISTVFIIRKERVGEDLAQRQVRHDLPPLRGGRTRSGGGPGTECRGHREAHL